MDWDQPEAEELIEHYWNTYSSLKKELKIQNPVSDVESKFLRKTLKFTSNLPGDLYTPAECVEEVESFAETINAKFNNEYGPNIYNDKLDILEFLQLIENFLANIFQKYFYFSDSSEEEEEEEEEELKYRQCHYI